MPMGKIYVSSRARRPARKLNRTQVKQVQRQIEKNKRIKNSYTSFVSNGPNGLFTFSNVAGASQVYTKFAELTVIPQGDNSTLRSEEQILLKSYNIKLGLDTYLNDDSGGATNTMVVLPFRIIIVRSKIGAQTDIFNTSAIPVSDWASQPDPDLYQVYTDEIISVSGNGSTSVQSNVAPGYLWHFYKSFKNKKVPHMIVGYDEDTGSGAIHNPIYMKIIVTPNATQQSNTFNFALHGFAHLKFFDKE